MSNYLVTGSRGGAEHVTSDQARNFHAGIVGDGRYIMSGLAATMQSANTCHITSGVACFNGADVEVPVGGADVTIENGTQGMKRNDLVVLRYSEDSGIESVDLTVIKGTPDASAPEDPAYNDGSILEGDDPVDMPLYRVPLDGVSVGDPEPMFSVSPTLASLGDSVSRIVIPLPLTKVATDTDFTVRGFVLGHDTPSPLAVVCVRWVNENELSLNAWNTSQLARMNGWSCPVIANCPSFSNDVFQAAGTAINFTVRATSTVGANEWHYGVMVFPVNKA